MKFRKSMLVLALCACSAAVHAHGEAGHEHAQKPRPLSTEETAFGREGDPRKVTRTIDVTMSDRMRFTPAKIAVRQGETVRFRVKNAGRTLHEMVVGTMADLEAHAALMRKHPGMEHDEPHMVHVAPGKTGSLVWQFTRAGQFHFGCLVPGHFEAGMVGSIEVREDAKGGAK